MFERYSYLANSAAVFRGFGNYHHTSHHTSTFSPKVYEHLLAADPHHPTTHCSCRVAALIGTRSQAQTLLTVDNCQTTYEHVNQPPIMASKSNNPEEDRPTILTGLGLENILPVSLNKRDRSMSRQPPIGTSPMDPSMSSMESSFMLDHWGSQSQTLDGTSTPNDHASSSKDEAKLTPISNWAHLSYIKNQRNNLRAELKAHQIAGAEAKQSVASLRRMAFRMAVNISVKEKQIATSARNLVRSRKSHYLEGKDAEKRVEELKRSLRIEEGRNKEILEALEKASMLTLQCKFVAADYPRSC